MKIKAQLIWVAFLLGTLGLTGCTTVNTAAKAQGSGEQVIYKAPLEMVWTAIPTLITNVGLKLVSVDADKHVFLAKHGISGWSWGENVAIFVEKVETNKTSVEVVTKRKMVTNIAAPEWDEPIFIQLDRAFKRD